MCRSTKNAVYIIITIIFIMSAILSYKAFYNSTEFSGSLKYSLTTRANIEVYNKPLLLKLKYFPRTASALRVSVINEDKSVIKSQIVYPKQIKKWNDIVLTYNIDHGKYFIKFNFNEAQQFFWHVKGEFYTMDLE